MERSQRLRWAHEHKINILCSWAIMVICIRRWYALKMRRQTQTCAYECRLDKCVNHVYIVSVTCLCHLTTFCSKLGPCLKTCVCVCVASMKVHSLQQLYTCCNKLRPCVKTCVWLLVDVPSLQKLSTRLLPKPLSNTNLEQVTLSLMAGLYHGPSGPWGLKATAGPSYIHLQYWPYFSSIFTVTLFA